MLAIVTLIQRRTMWPIFVDRLRSPFAFAAMLFVAWNALTLLWSKDVPGGIEALSAQRVLLLPLFWPSSAHHSWRYGLVFGTAVAGLCSVFTLIGMEIPGVQVFEGRIIPFQHPIVLGSLCAAGLCLSVDGWSLASYKMRIILTIAVGLTLCALLMSGSRSGLLASIFGVAICGVVSHRQVRFALVIGAFFAVVLALTQYRMIEQRWSSAWHQAAQWRESPESSAGWRIAALNAAWEVGSTRPWTGAGYGGVRSVISEDHPVRAQKERFSPEREGTPLNLHNVWANAFARTGIPGIALLVGMCVCALVSLRHTASIHQASGFGLLAVWGMLGLFDTALGTGVTLSILGLAMARRATPN